MFFDSATNFRHRKHAMKDSETPQTQGVSRRRAEDEGRLTHSVLFTTNQWDL